MSYPAAALSILIVLTALPAHAEAPPDLAAEGYPLDGLPRSVSPDGPMRCPKVELVDHPGTEVRWRSPLRVHPAFSTRLSAFEELVKAVALQVYGRAPTHIDHLGSFKCRRIARYPDLLSEHGLGNAVDIRGFSFGPAPRGSSGDLPKPLRRAFNVTLLDHWGVNAKAGSAAAFHRRFLRELAAAVEARPDLFSVLLGPAYPGHKDHFHFDRAPYRLVVL